MRRRFGSEQGMALPLALGVMLALTISVTSLVQLSSANARSSNASLARQDARAIAEDGFNRAASIVAANPSAAGPISGSASHYPNGASVSWTGTKSGTIWTVTATASVPNPTGAAAISHTSQAQLQLTSDVGAWNYVFASAPDPCLRIENTQVVSAPIYVRGNVCIQNNAAFAGTTLHVKRRNATFPGTVQILDNGRVGSAAAPVADVRVEGGCRYTSSGSFTTPCTSAHKVWASSFSSTVPDLSKPPVDLAYWYLNAKPGPKRYCTSGSFPGGTSAFDNNSSRDSSTSLVNLMPSTSYDCQVWEGGTLVGRLRWQAGNPGTLTITGTIFFDAEIKLTGTSYGIVSGTGTIYANSKITIENSARLCGAASCATSWNPNAGNMLYLISGSSAMPAIEVKNSSVFQGGLYAVGGFQLQDEAGVRGPVIADQVNILNNGASFPPEPLTQLAAGVPTGGGGATTVSLVPGSWAG